MSELCIVLINHNVFVTQTIFSEYFKEILFDTSFLQDKRTVMRIEEEYDNY
jgi:hypothetical protein